MRKHSGVRRLLKMNSLKNPIISTEDWEKIRAKGFARFVIGHSLIGWCIFFAMYLVSQTVIPTLIYHREISLTLIKTLKASLLIWFAVFAYSWAAWNTHESKRQK